jgi:membrane-associated phospholipid phosphatase
MKIYLIVILLLLSASGIYSQESDSLSQGSGRRDFRRFFYRDALASKFIFPTILISYGTVLMLDKSYTSIDQKVEDRVNKSISGKYAADDYAQFASTAAVYVLDLSGVKAKHDFADRTIVLAATHIIMGGIVTTMKNTIDVRRPDDSNSRSFPSGHTATAFAGAHVLYREYKDASPWIGIAGYTIATGTGILRITNKRHWVSDVVTGAGIGILSAELGYLLLPAVRKMTGMKNSDNGPVIVPSIGADGYGIGVVHTF